MRSLEAATQPEVEAPQQPSPEELKEKARREWKNSVEEPYSINEYDAIELMRKTIVTRDGEEWSSVLSHKRGPGKHKTIISSYSEPGRKSATFDHETGQLLFSFDVSFETCYELK